mgnify:CR=1 FL=1
MLIVWLVLGKEARVGTGSAEEGRGKRGGRRRRRGRGGTCRGRGGRRGRGGGGGINASEFPPGLLSLGLTWLSSLATEKWLVMKHSVSKTP